MPLLSPFKYSPSNIISPSFKSLLFSSNEYEIIPKEYVADFIRIFSILKENYDKKIKDINSVNESFNSVKYICSLYALMIIIENLNETLILCILFNFVIFYYILNRNYPHFISLFIDNSKNVFNNLINMINDSIPRYEGEE